MLENYKEVVEALEDTNESVISHRVNEVLRVLTAFSVVILPLTLIASIFGMNVTFPFEATRDGLLGDLGGMLGLLGRHAGLLPPTRLALRSGADGCRDRGRTRQDRSPAGAAARSAR